MKSSAASDLIEIASAILRCTWSASSRYSSNLTVSFGFSENSKCLAQRPRAEAGLFVACFGCQGDLGLGLCWYLSLLCTLFLDYCAMHRLIEIHASFRKRDDSFMYPLNSKLEILKGDIRTTLNYDKFISNPCQWALAQSLVAAVHLAGLQLETFAWSYPRFPSSGKDPQLLHLVELRTRWGRARRDIHVKPQCFRIQY